MAYTALRFDVDAAAADAWSDALLDAGALSVDIADKAAGTTAETALYGEPGVAPGAGWALARLTALFPAAADALIALAKAGDQLGLSPPPVREEKKKGGRKTRKRLRKPLARGLAAAAALAPGVPKPVISSSAPAASAPS